MVIRGGKKKKITKTSQNKENHKKNKTTEIPELNKHPLNHTVLIKSLWAPHSSTTLPNRTLLVLQDSQDHFHALQKDCEMFIDIHKHLQAAENWGNSKDCSKGCFHPPSSLFSTKRHLTISLGTPNCCALKSQQGLYALMQNNSVMGWSTSGYPCSFALSD